MTIEQYREKYGDAKVMGVDRAIVADYQKGDFTCRRDAILLYGGDVITLRDWVQQHMKPKVYVVKGVCDST